jgi:hypothetical protein
VGPVAAGLSDERNLALRAQAEAMQRASDALDDGLALVADALRAIALALVEANRLTREAFGIENGEQH